MPTPILALAPVLRPRGTGSSLGEEFISVIMDGDIEVEGEVAG